MPKSYPKGTATSQKCSQVTPKWSQTAPKVSSKRRKVPQDRRCLTKKDPKCTQVTPKWRHSHPNVRQSGPNVTPSHPKVTPKSPQCAPEWSQSDPKSPQADAKVTTSQPHRPKVTPMWCKSNPILIPNRSHAGKSTSKVIKMQCNIYVKSLKFIWKMCIFWKFTFIHPRRHYNDSKATFTCQKCTQDGRRMLPKSSQGAPKAPSYAKICFQIAPKWRRSVPKVRAKRHKVPEGRLRLPKKTSKCDQVTPKWRQSHSNVRQSNPNATPTHPKVMPKSLQCAPEWPWSDPKPPQADAKATISHPHNPNVTPMWCKSDPILVPNRSHAGKSNPKVVEIQFKIYVKSLKSIGGDLYFLKIHLHASQMTL